MQSVHMYVCMYLYVCALTYALQLVWPNLMLFIKQTKRLSAIRTHITSKPTI